MRAQRQVSARVERGILVSMVLAFLCVLLAVAAHAVPAGSKGKLDASIFSFDGHDFVRTESTLLTKDGKPAVGTKLAHDAPAFKALMDKHSFSGEATVFGRDYQANYAPLTDADGKLTGALFVGVPK
jgi:hypothetical protein